MCYYICLLTHVVNKWSLTELGNHVQALSLTLLLPVPNTSGFSFFYQRIRHHLLNMLTIKCDPNQQDSIRIDLHFVKSEYFPLTWSCGSRQRDTTSSGWKFKMNNLAVKWLIRCKKRDVDPMLGQFCRWWTNINLAPDRCRVIVVAIMTSIHSCAHRHSKLIIPVAFSWGLFCCGARHLGLKQDRLL